MFNNVLSQVAAGDTTQVTWMLRDYGWLTRPQKSHEAIDDGFQMLEAIWQLPEATKREMVQVLRQYPDAQLMYVSQIYVVKQMSFTATRGQRLGPDDPVDHHCVISHDGVYRFDRDDKQVSAQSMKLS